MKSDIHDLEKRGYVNEQDLQIGQSLSKEELCCLLHDESATNRTIAAFHLSALECDVLQALVIQLEQEKCLYTKLAICHSLEKGNRQTAKYLIRYLGKIGNNQHHKLPSKVSAKKSYPLPRDIIARTLGKMDIAIFPVLLEALQIEDRKVISEVLDAIGFMVFYHPNLANIENASHIYTIFTQYPEDSLLVWKALLCLSAFPLSTSKEILQSYSKHPTYLLQEEAIRSLQYMK